MFHYLLSFHYYARTDLDALAESAGTPDLTFLADSGAFSAKHAGAAVSIDAYAAWLRRWAHRIHAYANLDVLGDPVASARNLDTMRAMDLDPIPVFHLGEPSDYFEDAITSSNYVALGGMVRAALTKRDPKLWRYLTDLHKRAGKVGCRLHGFGLSSWTMIEGLPWYSVDSSSPGSGYRYGRVMVYDPYANRWVTFGVRDRKAWHRHGWLVREYGMRPQDFVGDAIRPALIAISARSWSRAASTLTGKRVYVTDTAFSAMKGGPNHGDVLRQWEEGNQWDTKVYVTDGTFQNGIQRGEAPRIGAYEAGNHWDTRVYVTDPHPSAGKNIERIVAWEDGNRWAERQGAPDGAVPATANPGQG